MGTVPAAPIFVVFYYMLDTGKPLGYKRINLILKVPL